MTALVATKDVIFIARGSGIICQLRLPHLSLEFKYSQLTDPTSPHTALNIPIQSIFVNCDVSKIAILDIASSAKILELDKIVGTKIEEASKTSSSRTNGALLDFARKDVWDIKWASDNPDLFAIMEKTKLYVFRTLDPEEPLNSSGYICEFSDLQIKTVLMDDVVIDPENLKAEMITLIETKSLRDTRSILSQVGLADAYQFVENNPHRRLWRLVGEAALRENDYAAAQKAFVRCLDYHAIQFVKKLRLIEDKAIQKAEICAFSGRFEEAEQGFLGIDRRDLAIELRARLGDWSRVLQLLKEKGNAAGDSQMLETAYNGLGDYFMDRQRSDKAVEYYVLGKNYVMLAECYYLLERYDDLSTLARNLPEHHHLIKEIGDRFMSVGVSEEAVTCYVRAGDVKKAVDSCVYLNQWNQAIKLAEECKLNDIEALLNQYASHLIDDGKSLSAIELFKKAGYHHRSAQLLYEFADGVAASERRPMLLKRVYVIAAIEADMYHAQRKNKKSSAKSNDGDDKIMSMLKDESTVTGSRYFASPWRPAEAYHFFVLCQRYYYSGQFDKAHAVASRLSEYENYLDHIKLYTLQALCAAKIGQYAACSRAFMRLESITGEGEKYQRLAFKLFVQHPPVDRMNDAATETCPICASAIPEMYDLKRS